MRKNRLRDYCEYFLFRSISCWLRSRPISAALASHKRLARFWYDRLKIRKEVTLENLRYAFPQANDSQIDNLARNVFLHFSRMAIEYIILPKVVRKGLDHWIGSANWQVLEQVFKRQKGVILLSGHIGNWELLGAAIALKGYPLWGVAEDQRNSIVDHLINEHRYLTGMKIIRRDQAKAVLPQIFRKGEIVALVSDQDAGRHGIFVPFMGRPASTPAGAAVYSYRYDVPLLYSIACYQNGKYNLYFEELPRPNHQNGLQEYIYQATEMHVNRLEQDIMRYPEQWFWLHRRWKTSIEEAESRG